MSKVTSKDGTTIAFEKSGKGPAIVLVNGAMGYREFFGGRPLAAELSRAFTVYDYDRRGRGESTDTQPYAVEREIEDIEALIAEAGGSAYLYGISSGAVLALKAAAILGTARVPKLALYEPPFNSDDDKAKQEFAHYSKRMAELLAANRRGDAVTLFIGDMLPAEMLEEMRQSPEWRIMEAVAPTLAYDNAVMGDGAVPVEAARAATLATLVMDGGEREGEAFFYQAVQDLMNALPSAQHHTLEGQPHSPVAPGVLAPVLREFFNSR